MDVFLLYGTKVKKFFRITDLFVLLLHLDFTKHKRNGNQKVSSIRKRMAMDLAWEVFIEFEGPDYPQEGTDHFRSFIDNTEMVGEMEVYGAFDGNILAGMIALRSSGSHISLLCAKRISSEASASGCSRLRYEAGTQRRLPSTLLPMPSGFITSWASPPSPERKPRTASGLHLWNTNQN